jgi:hypothetical protein
LSHRITEANPVDGTFNLPGSSPDNSDETSEGWSDSDGLSSEEGEVVSDLNGSQSIESSMIKSTADGLMLVSDDENQVDDDEYLSDTALSLNAFKKPSLQAYEETNPEASSETENSQSKIPFSVALQDLPHEQHELDYQGIDDPGRNYDARYDGSLQDLMQGEQGGLVVIDDEGDDSDSSDEMAGYLSTGEVRLPNLLLTPYVGERPPTPPSPSRSTISRSPKNEPLAPEVKSFTSNPPMPTVPMMEFDEGAYDQYDQSAVEQIYGQDTYNGSCEEDERYSGVPYGDQEGVEFPRAVGRAQSPAGMTSKDEESATFVSLAKANKKDRRLIRILAVGLGCALVSLAAVVGGVVALSLFNGKDENSPAPASPVIAPTPMVLNKTVQTLAPVGSPHVASAPPTKAPAIEASIRAPTTEAPTAKAPITEAQTQAPSAALVQTMTAPPTTFIGSVKIPL